MDKELRGLMEHMSEWISVKDGLPEAEQEVRLYCKTGSGSGYQCQGFYVPYGIHREDSDFVWDWSGCNEYDEEKDDYIIDAGWYERVHNWDEYSACEIYDTVTHWMPLPEGPKEG